MAQPMHIIKGALTKILGVQQLPQNRCGQQGRYWFPMYGQKHRSSERSDLPSGFLSGVLRPLFMVAAPHNLHGSHAVPMILTNIEKKRTTAFPTPFSTRQNTAETEAFFLMLSPFSYNMGKSFKMSFPEAPRWLSGLSLSSRPQGPRIKAHIQLSDQWGVCFPTPLPASLPTCDLCLSNK